MVKEGKYLYGIIEANSKKTFGLIGIGDGREVYTIPHQDIGAIVSDSSIMHFDFTSKETILHHLAIHQATLEEVMKGYNIVPMKFGTVVKDEEELKRILDGGYTQFKNALQVMKGKIELDVVVLWSNLDSILKEVGEEEEIKRFKEEVAKKTPQEILEAKIELGKMVKALLDRKREKFAVEILDVLKKEAEDHRLHDLMDDSMIMNIAFLINKSKEEGFTGKVSQLDEKYEDKINFKIVGPLPPYSFSTLEIKRVEFEKIDEARRILELEEEATLSQIKEMYKKLSKEFHPDKYPGNPEAQKRFERITKAYQIVSDYCKEDKCSFREAEVKDFAMVKVLEVPRVFK